MKNWVRFAVATATNGVWVTGAVMALLLLPAPVDLAAMVPLAAAAALYEHCCRKACRRVLWPFATPFAAAFAQRTEDLAAEQARIQAGIARATDHIARIRRTRERMQANDIERMTIQLLDAQLTDVALTPEGFLVRMDPGNTVLIESTGTDGTWERLPLNGTDGNVEPYELAVPHDAADTLLLLNSWRDDDVSCTITLDAGEIRTVEFVNLQGRSVLLNYSS